jgi:signal peptidase I
VSTYPPHEPDQDNESPALAPTGMPNDVQVSTSSPEYLSTIPGATAQPRSPMTPLGTFPPPFPPVPPPSPLQYRQRPPERSTGARLGEELVAWFKTLVSAGVYATLIVTFGFQVARVEGQSMAPTLEDQDRLIVNKLEYRLPNHSPRVGDIVMLLYPNDPDKSFVKRVVAEPGDSIRSVNGHVYRNEVPLPEDFIPEEFRSYDTWGPEIVREGYYFVMGDHRNNSSDSRTWGLVPKKYIIGRVQLRWWPLTEARLFSDWR